MSRVAVIGSGGREHSLAWKLAQDKDVFEVFCLPGNGGTVKENKVTNLEIDCTKVENFDRAYDFVREKGIDLVVVGPEGPLSLGIVDHFNFRGYDRIFGPTKEGTELEGDKFLSYDIMREEGIAQAPSVKCEDLDSAEFEINRIKGKGVVIKSRGLAEGKGVLVCDSIEEALAKIRPHIEKYGAHNLIAERLYPSKNGGEYSVFGISDGENVVPFEMAFQDFKRLGNGNKGPNTGGMGAYGPVDFVSKEDIFKINREIMTPVVRSMKERGKEFKGFLYVGMMRTGDGDKVIEFNARFGDPECQPAMMMLNSGLYGILSNAVDGNLRSVKMEFNPGAACCVVLASNGYPVDYSSVKGRKIEGINFYEGGNGVPGLKIFHAGTKRSGDDLLIGGGRVLGVTGYKESSIVAARELAYLGVGDLIDQNRENLVCRNDIANGVGRINHAD